MFSSPPLYGRGLSLITASRLCLLYHLWTDRCLDLFPFMVLKLLCPVHHIWTGESIILFSFPPSGPEVLTDKLIRLSLNSELRSWCLLVGLVQSITSELTGAQIQFTLAVPSGLDAMLTLWPLNNGLWAWCLLVGHVQIISEPTGAQIQFTLAVASGLAAKLIRLPLAADLEFGVS